MSKIEKLSIRGIRSFDQQEEVKIEFFRPLTLIQGHNGSGKTTIIECLKMASCGSFPPLSTNGKTFIMDPKITNSSEVQASIKLKFLTPKEKEMLVIKNFQLTQKPNGKYEFKRLEQMIKSIDNEGKLVTLNSTVDTIDKQVPLLMHASKAIIENVIFCHQEDTLWPFSESGNLKKVFDEIFDTAKYTKVLEDLKDQIKQYNGRLKELKTQSSLLEKDYENFISTRSNLENCLTDLKELEDRNAILNNEKTIVEKEFSSILEIEKSLITNEKELYSKTGVFNVKQEQIKLLLNNPEFKDFTYDEEVYIRYINEYKMFNKQASEIHEKITNLNIRKKELIDGISSLKKEWECIRYEKDSFEKKEKLIDCNRVMIIDYLYESCYSSSLNSKSSKVGYSSDTIIGGYDYNSINNDIIYGGYGGFSNSINRVSGYQYSNNNNNYNNSSKKLIKIRDNYLLKISINNDMTNISDSLINNSPSTLEITDLTNHPYFTKQELLKIKDLQELYNVIQYNEQTYSKKLQETQDKENSLKEKISKLRYQLDFDKKNFLNKEEELKYLITKREEILKSSSDNKHLQNELHSINLEIDEIHIKQTNINIKFSSIENELDKRKEEMEEIKKSAYNCSVRNSNNNEISSGLRECFRVSGDYNINDTYNRNIIVNNNDSSYELEKNLNDLNDLINRISRFTECIGNLRRSFISFSNNNMININFNTINRGNQVSKTDNEYNNIENILAYYKSKVNEINEAKQELKQQQNNLNNEIDFKKNLIQTNDNKLLQINNKIDYISKEVNLNKSLAYIESIVPNKSELIRLISKTEIINIRNSDNLLNIILTNSNTYGNFISILNDSKEQLSISLSRYETIISNTSYSISCLKEKDNCELCDKHLTNKEKEIVNSNLNMKVQDSLNRSLEVKNQLEAINECFSEISNSKNIIENLFALVKEKMYIESNNESYYNEMNGVMLKLRELELRSKEKTHHLESLCNDINIESIGKLIYDKESLSRGVVDILKSKFNFSIERLNINKIKEIIGDVNESNEDSVVIENADNNAKIINDINVEKNLSHPYLAININNNSNNGDDYSSIVYSKYTEEQLLTQLLNLLSIIKQEFTSILEQTSSIENKEKQINSIVTNLEIQKSSLLQELNILNKELRNKELSKQEKMKLLNYDSNSQTELIEKEINNKIFEKESLENKYLSSSKELSSLETKLDILNNSERLETTRQELEKIASLLKTAKYKLEMLLYEVKVMKQSINNNSNSNSSINNYNFNSNSNNSDINCNIPITVETYKLNLTTKLDLLSSQIKEKDMHLQQIDKELSSQNRIIQNKDETNYNLNTQLKQLKKDTEELYQEITSQSKIITTLKQKLQIKNELQHKVENIRKNISENLGAMNELTKNLNRLKFQYQNSKYFNIEDRFNNVKLEFIMTIETIRTIENYYESLDKTLILYHARRMEEINKLINYYWSMTYKGRDIKTIEIKSDMEKVNVRSRGYNYRIVLITNE